MEHRSDGFCEPSGLAYVLHQTGIVFARTVGAECCLTFGGVGMAEGACLARGVVSPILVDSAIQTLRAIMEGLRLDATIQQAKIAFRVATKLATA